MQCILMRLMWHSSYLFRAMRLIICSLLLISRKLIMSLRHYHAFSLFLMRCKFESQMKTVSATCVHELHANIIFAYVCRLVGIGTPYFVHHFRKNDIKINLRYLCSKNATENHKLIIRWNINWKLHVPFFTEIYTFCPKKSVYIFSHPLFYNFNEFFIIFLCVFI